MRNGDWLAPLNFSDVIDLASNFTVPQFLDHETFRRRLDEGKPLYLHEFMYALMQAYDAYHMKTDVQVGGVEQLFNIMAGRQLQRAKGEKPADRLCVPLLIGTDGHAASMSKSTGNYIGLDDAAGRHVRQAHVDPRLADASTTTRCSRTLARRECRRSNGASRTDGQPDGTEEAPGACSRLVALRRRRGGARRRSSSASSSAARTLRKLASYPSPWMLTAPLTVDITLELSKSGVRQSQRSQATARSRRFEHRWAAIEDGHARSARDP